MQKLLVPCKQVGCSPPAIACLLLQSKQESCSAGRLTCHWERRQQAGHDVGRHRACDDGRHQSADPQRQIVKPRLTRPVLQREVCGRVQQPFWSAAHSSTDGDCERGRLRGILHRGKDVYAPVVELVCYIGSADRMHLDECPAWRGKPPCGVAGRRVGAAKVATSHLLVPEKLKSCCGSNCCTFCP